MNQFYDVSFLKMLDRLPYAMSKKTKEALAKNVDYFKLNQLVYQFPHPYLIITLGSNLIQVGDGLSPKALSNYRNGLLTSITNFFNKRIDILITEDIKHQN